VQQAIKNKIVLEVSGVIPADAPVLQRAQADAAGPVNCLFGETQMRELYGN